MYCIIHAWLDAQCSLIRSKTMDNTRITLQPRDANIHVSSALDPAPILVPLKAIRALEFRILDFRTLGIPANTLPVFKVADAKTQTGVTGL